MYSVHCVQSGG